MLKLVRFVILVALSPMVFSLGYEAYQFLTSGLELQAIVWFLYGGGFYFALYLALLGNRIRFLEVLEHELAHTLLLLVFFEIPVRLEASESEGGIVSYRNARGDFLVALAPYYLPVLTIPLLLVQPFMSGTVDSAVDFLIGFTLAFHCAALIWRELRPRQPDLRAMGLPFSLIVIVLFNAIGMVVILSAVSDNHPAVLDYFRTSWQRARALYVLLWEAYQTLELPVLQELIEQSTPFLSE